MDKDRYGPAEEINAVGRRYDNFCMNEWVDGKKVRR